MLLDSNWHATKKINDLSLALGLDVKQIDTFKLGVALDWTGLPRIQPASPNAL